MRFLRRFFVGLGLFVATLGVLGLVAYFAVVARPRFLSVEARAAHARMLAPGLRLVVPPRQGPFPTVLLIHGCGGLHGDNGPNPIMDEYARSAVKAGWAAAILDSFTPRGWAPAWARNQVCGGLRLNGFMRSADVLAGLDLLQADKRVDHRHLRVASWSHGGWALGELLILPDPGDGSLRRTLAGIEAVRFTYPFCNPPSRAGLMGWNWKGDVRFELAQNDRVQKPSGCTPLADRAREAGSTVEVEVIPGATHAFDERVQTPDSAFKFNPAATAHSHAEFIRWLATPVTLR